MTAAMAETEIPQDVRELAERYAGRPMFAEVRFTVANAMADAIMADRASRAPDRDVLVEALRAGKAKIEQRGSSNHGDEVTVYFPPYHKEEAEAFAKALSAIEAAQ